MMKNSNTKNEMTQNMKCHVTHDMGGGVGWTFSQNFISSALSVCELWFVDDLEEKYEQIT